MTSDAASCDHVPFCAFFKNGVMVHDPFTLEGLVSPIYICVYFDNPPDMVEIVEVHSSYPGSQETINLNTYLDGSTKVVVILEVG